MKSDEHRQLPKAYRGLLTDNCLSDNRSPATCSRYPDVRIIAGKWAGRHLTSPGGRVRPTAEPVRDVWLHLLEPHLQDARVLDLFAGTGALGLEALSRGARSADFVENGPSSLHALKANIAALRVRNRTRVFKKDALPFTASLAARSYSIAFADPPYGSRMLDRVIETWQRTHFADILSVEHASDHELPAGGRTTTLSETSLTLYAAPPRSDSDAP